MPQSYQAYHYLREALDWYGPEGIKKNGYLTLTEIGRLYDRTSHDVGAKLKELHLRDGNGRPTERAFTLELVAPRGCPKFTWAWHKEKTCAILETEDGWVRHDD